MALIRQIDVITKAHAAHAERPCTACYEPESFLQLDTYASEKGRLIGAVKQSLRFEREGAVRLLELIGLAFPDLLGDAREQRLRH